MTKADKLDICKPTKRLSRVALKILDRALDAKIEDTVKKLKIFGISASAKINDWFHDYEGRNYRTYCLVVRKGNLIVLDVRIDKPLATFYREDGKKYIAEVKKYISGGWEWRVLRAA